MRAGLAVNGRFQGVRQSGVQRVAAELVERLKTPHALLAPAGRAGGVGGYAWEQFSLPRGLGDRLLWSPCNVGPVSVRRQILTIHDAAVLDHPEWFSKAFVLAYRSIWRALTPRVCALVTVSDYSRRRLSETLGRPLSSIQVVPNGVAERFSPASPEAVAAERQRAGLGEVPYFLALGTLEPRKNVALVLAAWARARAHLPRGAMLAVAGGRGESAIFADGQDALDAQGVIPLGHVPDSGLPALISGAWGLAYPSLYEGFGLPVLEAMACGAPVMTTRLTSLPDVAGDAALYVDPQDPAELANAFIRLAGSADLRHEMGQRGLERARRFSWTTSAALMDELISAHL